MRFVVCRSMGLAYQNIISRVLFIGYLSSQKVVSEGKKNVKKVNNFLMLSYEK